MRCSLLVLSTYLDGELEVERRSELEAHMVGCQRCRAGLDHLREEARLIATLAPVHVSNASAEALFEQLGLSGPAATVAFPTAGADSAPLTRPRRERQAPQPWTPPSPVADALTHEEVDSLSSWAEVAMAGPLTPRSAAAGAPSVDDVDLAVEVNGLAGAGWPSPTPFDEGAAGEADEAPVDLLAPDQALHDEDAANDTPGVEDLDDHGRDPAAAAPAETAVPPAPAGLPAGDTAFALAAGRAAFAALFEGFPTIPETAATPAQMEMRSQPPEAVEGVLEKPSDPVAEPPAAPVDDGAGGALLEATAAADATPVAASPGEALDVPPPASPQQPAGPIPARRPGTFRRIAERAAVTMALSRPAGADIDGSVELHTGAGVPLRPGRHRERAARGRAPRIDDLTRPQPAIPTPVRREKAPRLETVRTANPPSPRLIAYGAVVVILAVIGLLTGRSVTPLGSTHSPATASRSHTATPRAAPLTAVPSARASAAAPSAAVPSGAAPSAAAPSTAPTSAGAFALTGSKTVGTAGGAGFTVSEFGYGIHPGYFRVKLVLDNPSDATSEPAATFGFLDPQTLVIELPGVAPAASVGTLPSSDPVVSVNLLQPSPVKGATVYELKLTHAVQISPFYLLSPTRLVVDLS